MAEPAVDPTMLVLGRLTETIERLLIRQAEPIAPRLRVNTPTFNGKGDVELFIRQFGDVAHASEWTERVELLQLRDALQDDAKDCGRSADPETILQISEIILKTSGTYPKHTPKSPKTTRAYPKFVSLFIYLYDS